MLIWLLVIVAILFICFLIFKYFKTLKIGSLVLVSGGVKTGKTCLAVFIATREYKKALLKWHIRKLFGKKEEKPLLYSNVPLNCEYVPLEQDFLIRQKRFNYKSIILISEASLFADSQLIKDQDINEQLLLFNKLIGHETKGGKLIYDTQQIQDCHYSIKRSLSSYFDIHHINKYIPFYILAYVREYKYSEDRSTVNTVDEDVEDSLKMVIIPKRVWRLYDQYCYSVLTDDLPAGTNNVNGRQLPDLKAHKIPSFRPFKNLKKGSKENEG